MTAVQRLRSLCVIAAICLAAGGARADSAPQHDRFLGYVGRATRVDRNEFLYGESHVLRYRDRHLVERVVLYTCRDGSAFARKRVDYVSPTAPDFLLEDESNGMREGVRSAQGGARSVFFQRSHAEAEKSGPITASPDLVIDAGFDEFIRARWQALMSGQPQAFEFVVPSRTESIPFAVRHVHSITVDGVPSELLELKVAGILGWIAPTIQVAYSAADHVLVRYLGVTDLRDRNNDNFKARITFAPQDRKDSSAAAFDEARRAPLRPCQ